MFFPEKIKSIEKNNKVLEIGPGSTPYWRSNVLLEKNFSSEELLRQNGRNGTLETDKKIIYYDGPSFPFSDYEFDYVICSHVLEHIPANELPHFISELQRVAKKGYIEFPTVYYDYLYNFDVHVTLLLYHNETLNYYSKTRSKLNQFYGIQQFFYETAVKGYNSLTEDLKVYYFQGFEWKEKIKLTEATELAGVLYEKSLIASIKEKNNLIENGIRFHGKELLKALKKKLIC